MQAIPRLIGSRIIGAHGGVSIAWIIFLLIGAASLSHAENANGENTDWEITADRLTYDSSTETYIADGNVRITREGRILTADSVRVDQLRGLAWAEGNVHLLSGLDRLSGRSLQLSLRDETGALQEGSVFLSENNVYLTGARILKTGAQTYYVREASVTTCDGPDPDWRITGRDLQVTIEGYGFIKHAAFRVADIPILYTPYFIFPVKLRRQSGLLTPELGFSDRRGAEYLQPFFWAIGDSMDATFYAHYMSERGLRLGAEYRYMASERSFGTFIADGFEDRRIDDGLADRSARWGYPDDAHLRTNTDRYWVRGKINQDLPWAVTAKVDLDVVSDQDYLHDFRGGASGYDESRAVFQRTFGRDIDDFTQPLRENQLNLNRLWTSYSFNGNLRWYHDAVQDRPPGTFTPLQNLPEITLDGIKQNIGRSPFFYNLNSSYSYFYREEGNRAHRADLYPRFYYTTRLFDAVSVEPSIGIRQTLWHRDQYETETTENRNQVRTLYDLRLDTGTDLFRIYSIDRAGSDRIKHNIRPQLIYQYIPEEEQDDLPLFDDLDRIEEQNLITLALTQTLIARRPSLTDLQDASYIPFMRFRLEQSFDINRYNDNDPRPFSDLLAELDIHPGQYIRLDADARWRTYDGEFYAYNLALALWNLRGDRFIIDYRFTRAENDLPGIKSINTTAMWQATPRWQLRGRYEHDLQANQLLETGVGFSYLSQCWGVNFDYRMDADNNSSFSASVNLAGLGSIGR